MKLDDMLPSFIGQINFITSSIAFRGNLSQPKLSTANWRS